MRSDDDANAMDLDHFDHRLSELRAASEIVTANLFELDAHRVRHMLDAATLTGTSAVRWQAATRDLADLWRLLPILSTFVRRVGDRRGTKRSVSESSLTALCRLVEGPSVELEVTAVPLEERGVLDSGEVSTWCTVDELLARMAAAFNRVNSAIADASRAWDQYAPRVSSVQASLDATDMLLTELGGDTDDLTEQRDVVRAVATRLIEDPMSVDEAAIADVETRAARAQDDVESASHLKTDFEDAHRNANALLTQLEGLAHAIDEAHDEVSSKIVEAGVPRPTPTELPALREELAGVV